MTDGIPDAIKRNDVIYRLVPLREAHDSVRLGWVPTPALDGTVHGQWSVLMFWVMCGCPMRVPRIAS